jgi:phosphate-selective porin OprO/OprP
MRYIVQAIVTVACVVSSGPAFAQAAAQPDKPASVYDKIWKFAEWYNDDTNPAIQRVLFSGRFQHDFAVLNADQGDHEESNVRRLRLGPRITFLKKYLFHMEVELNPQERDPFYLRITDLYVSYTRNSQFVLTVGKQSLPFTIEGATSSRELITIDRSNIGNNIWFPQEYMPGVSVSGRRAAWNYRGGIYSAGAMNRELGEFNGGVFTLAVLGYDFAKQLGIKQALVTGNYVFQPSNTRNTFTRQLDHIVSTHAKFDLGDYGFQGEVTAASGYLGQSNLWAVLLMPFVNVTDEFQVVGRYTHLGSEGGNGIRLTTYESRLVPGRGDDFNEFYLGANYYFYGHKLKLQSGLAYADMDDEREDGGAYSGLSWVTGLRVGW